MICWLKKKSRDISVIFQDLITSCIICVEKLLIYCQRRPCKVLNKLTTNVSVILFLTIMMNSRTFPCSLELASRVIKTELSLQFLVFRISVASFSLSLCLNPLFFTFDLSNSLFPNHSELFLTIFFF